MGPIEARSDPRMSQVITSPVIDQWAREFNNSMAVFFSAGYNAAVEDERRPMHYRNDAWLRQMFVSTGREMRDRLVDIKAIVAEL